MLFLNPKDINDYFIDDIMPRLSVSENIKLFTDYILKHILHQILYFHLILRLNFHFIQKHQIVQQIV